MSKNPPSRSFWRNVTLIALAHVALIAGLIRWSLAARSAPDAESLVWLSGMDDLAAEKSENSATSPTQNSVQSGESEALRTDEKEQPFLTEAKSEIELPKPTPMETPKAFGVPKATAKPKTTTKPTPKKTVLAKASKSSAHPKSGPPKSKGEQTDASNEKKKSAKTVNTKTK